MIPFRLALHCLLYLNSVHVSTMDKPSRLCTPRRGLNVLPLLPPTNGLFHLNFASISKPIVNI